MHVTAHILGFIMTVFPVWGFLAIIIIKGFVVWGFFSDKFM